MNRYINRDLKLVAESIRANKLSLNTSKTELKPRHKKNSKHLNFCISGQKLQPSSQMKYLGVILQDDLHWTTHLANLKKKLSRNIGLLSKIRHYVRKHVTNNILFIIQFSFNLCL